MKAAIIGYGKMGHEIERILIERGHTVSLIIDEANAADLNEQNLKDIDVAIEFTTPSTAYNNIRQCIECGTPVVSGTTGWTERLEELKALCEQKGSAIFYASNYSLGVNMMFRLNRRLAELMNHHPQYEVAIEEVHPQKGCSKRHSHNPCRRYTRKYRSQSQLGESDSRRVR